MSEPIGMSCPGCNQPPLWLLGGGRQAFCGTHSCRVFIWDPADTMDEMLEKLNVIDLSVWLDDSGTEGTRRPGS